MIRRDRRGSIARSAGLIALATLAVHQLRYLIAYGSSAHEQLLRQGHSYLFGALPILISFAVATIAAGLVRVALGNSPAGAAGASPRIRVLIYAASIAAVFAVQESAEGLLSAGHSSGFAAIFGGGGWIAMPLALLFGVLCAALDGGFARLESRLATVDPPSRPLVALPAQPLRTRIAVPLVSSPLAFGLARRPPPLAA